MSQLHQNARIVLETVHLAEELRRMHRVITEREFPAALRDDFHAQCEEIERVTGGDEYRRTRRRARSLNVLSLALALPVLLAAVGFIGYDRFVPDADLFGMLFRNMMVFWAVTAIAILLILGVLVCAIAHRTTNRRLLGRIYPALLERAGLA